MTRSSQAQIQTAQFLRAMFAQQIAEHDRLEADGTLHDTEHGRDLAARIDGLRQGHAEWTTRITELEEAQ